LTEHFLAYGSQETLLQYARGTPKILLLVTSTHRLLATHSSPSKEKLMKPKTLLPFLLLGSSSIAYSQGTFQDLDFEQATIVRLGTGYSAASAFPGWQTLIGTTSTSVVLYDAVSIGAPDIAIIDDKTGYVPIQGNYTAYLMSATLGSQSTSVSLTQTGIVPAGTESIQLDANQEQGSSFVVSLGGDTISMVPLETFSGYTLYGGNISAWSGQNATLSITELPPSDQEFSPSLLQLDNIVFSPAAIPEASPLVLTGVGGLLFALYRRFAPKRQ
jgi:hypothetical protein